MELFVLRFRLSSRLKRSRLKFLFLAFYSILSSNREIERESLRFFFYRILNMDILKSFSKYCLVLAACCSLIE